MAKTKSKVSVQFVCRSCGSTTPRWAGKCPACGEWDSLEEFKVAKGANDDTHRGAVGLGETLGGDVEVPAARLMQEIDLSAGGGEGGARIVTGIGELDRVLGGGLVPGSAVLIGGDPGIGKSTLMLQAAQAMGAGKKSGRPIPDPSIPDPSIPDPSSDALRVGVGGDVLYVTSEESAQQLRMRADRLGGVPDPSGDALRVGVDEGSNLYALADTNLARILEQARQVKPKVVVIDSIQMIYKSDLPAAPGSVSQLRACTLELVYFAKASGIALLLVGHVTKQGQLAGPRLLEHMVDTVLYFEGDRYHSYRVVRGIKNRFGTTLEVGLFEMGDGGLKEVTDGSGLLAAEYEARSGSVVCPVLHGSRCLLVEVQALTATGVLGAAKRKVSGLDSNRLAMLIAVLEKRGGLRLADQDIFASSVGGMKIVEPAVDLAVALAIAGAHLDKRLPAGMLAVGEIGLGGEVRHVQQMEQRLAEAVRLGFTRLVVPKSVPASLVKGLKGKDRQVKVELNRVGSVEEALGCLD